MPWPHKLRRKLDFEFGKRRRPTGVLPWLVLAATLLVAGDVGRTIILQRKAYQTLAAQVAQLPPAAPRSVAVAYVPKDLERELALARAVVHRIATPWNDLFRALGECDTDGVALLTVEPDTAGGSVQVTAEARDLPAMLTYLARLEARPEFPRAVLVRHEARKSEPRQAVFFIASLTWIRR